MIKRLLPAADVLMAPIVFPAAWLLKAVRRIGVQRLPACRSVLMHVGVFPIRNHYYEPKFDHRVSGDSFSHDRPLPGIRWNVTAQLDLLAKFRFSRELVDLPSRKPDTLGFYFGNGAFESGDAEYWYQIIRAVRPARIIEIGSGNSTLMAIRAIRANQADDAAYRCEHTCIEPYEMPWLERSGVEVIRSKVEDVDVSFFSRLGANDILFIDSSHIIQPEGDVLFEYLNLLPRLNKGVIVHVHDIFSPKNYLREWLRDDVKFWNEQYVLEAFLTHNDAWDVIGAVNYLKHHHYDALKTAAPYLTPDREPGSFYIQKVA